MVETDSSSQSCESAAHDDSQSALRCICGCLLARLVPGGVELKCRRCKRTLFVPFDTQGAGVPCETRS